MKPENELLSMFDEFITEKDQLLSSLSSKLCNKLIKYRLDNHMSQKEFAGFLGISQSMVSKIENEQYNFTIETLVKIFYKLGLELNIDFKILN